MKVFRLPDHQRMILQGFADGKKAQQIADEIGLARTTVYNYIARMESDLELSSRVHLIAHAFRQGWIE